MKHRHLRSLSSLIGRGVSAAVRTAVVGIFVAGGSIAILRFLGVPLPSTQELMHNLESITRLARILS